MSIPAQPRAPELGDEWRERSHDVERFRFPAGSCSTADQCVGSMTRRSTAMVFAPYLATMGGGERVICEVAGVLSECFAVEVCSPQVPDPVRWTRLGFPALKIRKLNAREFAMRTLRAEVAVVMSNGVPLPSLAHRSYLIVQFPGDSAIPATAWKRLRTRAALSRYSVATYSKYNQAHIEERWGVRATVLAPPVTQYLFDPVVKSPLILSVGRLSTDGGHKRHDALLDAWSLAKQQLPGWELVIAGAVREGEVAADGLRQRAAEIGSARIETDLSPDDLAVLYRRASIYWHAAGYGRSPDRPDLAEHFGMSTVEAMSAGAVPVVYSDGGQVEIVEGSRGRFWTTLEELVSETVSLALDPDLSSAAEQVNGAAKAFNREAFRAKLLELVSAKHQCHD